MAITCGKCCRMSVREFGHPASAYGRTMSNIPTKIGSSGKSIQNGGNGLDRVVI